MNSSRSKLGGLAAVVATALLSAACDDGSESEAAPPAAVACLPGPTDHDQDDTLRLNHLQAKSTHNSYHIEPEGNSLDDWRYTHLPLDQQLETQGVRHFELDLRFDADLEVFEVYHLLLIDQETTCRLLTDCLATIRSWSDLHCSHHPIVVQLELKDSQPADVEAYFAKLHAALLAAWPVERIITPAAVRGDHASLAAALASDGWPALGGQRGKVLFMLDDGGAFQEAYTHGHQHLEDRLIFAQGNPDQPFAAVAVINDPLGGASAITTAIEAGLLVRTRADSGSVEPLNEDFARQQAALDSGAHFVTTDYPAAVSYTDYWLDIPDGTPSRCNPVTSPAGCESTAIEDPELVAPR
ncbi:MAG: hypothetical protein JRI68_05165 [Deltaproteobacteria bacterium]|nr:hypothetical protein [Deltaproteobacteria bacterium]